MLANPAVLAFVSLAQTWSFPKRHIVIRPGDPPQSIFLILEGSVMVVKTEGPGREIILAHLSAGDFFGEMCLFPDQPTRTAMVRTRSRTLLAVVDYAAFRDFAALYPDIMFVLAGQLAARLRDTSRRLGDLAFVDVAGRVAQALLECARMPDARRNPDGLVLRISRAELANHAGCSREMASRVLRRMEEDGLVGCGNRRICLYDQALRSTARQRPTASLQAKPARTSSRRASRL